MSVIIHNHFPKFLTMYSNLLLIKTENVWVEMGKTFHIPHTITDINDIPVMYYDVLNVDVSTQYCPVQKYSFIGLISSF